MLPGDTLTQSVSYQAADNSYDMVITSKALGKSIRMNYALLSKQTADETTAFIVVEHAPEKCDQASCSPLATWPNRRILTSMLLHSTRPTAT